MKDNKKKEEGVRLGDHPHLHLPSGWAGAFFLASVDTVSARLEAGKISVPQIGADCFAVEVVQSGDLNSTIPACPHAGGSGNSTTRWDD